MVGLVMYAMRDGQSKDVIEACFERRKKNLPIAPALGLFLDRVLRSHLIV